MKQIAIYVEQLISGCGVGGSAVAVVSHIVMVVAAVLMAVLAEWVCRRVFVPLVLKVTARTEARWDDVIFNKKVLVSTCRIVPALVIWSLLPLIFFKFPTVHDLLGRLTAIYITVMTVRTLITFFDSFKLLEGDHRTARQQYLYSVFAVVKIIIIFITVIIIVSILFDKDPTTLLAGLGAASAILMLAFQDTIKGLVAGIRLTSNDMLHIGDWIAVPSAGANGRVEEITLTMVKVRNFDNTVVTVTPQMLVDGSFQNWLGMEEREGRKQVRRVYYDFRSIATEKGDSAEAGTTNITRFRQHIEEWLGKHPKVVATRPILVRQAEATQAGCCVEFAFWLKAQDGLGFEHDTSDIMEYIYAAGNDFGLRIYQQFPEQQASE